jgi:hypothetical protein
LLALNAFYELPVTFLACERDPASLLREVASSGSFFPRGAETDQGSCRQQAYRDPGRIPPGRRGFVRAAIRLGEGISSLQLAVLFPDHKRSKIARQKATVFTPRSGF